MFSSGVALATRPFSSAILTKLSKISERLIVPPLVNSIDMLLYAGNSYGCLSYLIDIMVDNGFLISVHGRDIDFRLSSRSVVVPSNLISDSLEGWRRLNGTFFPI